MSRTYLIPIDKSQTMYDVAPKYVGHFGNSCTIYPRKDKDGKLLCGFYVVQCDDRCDYKWLEEQSDVKRIDTGIDTEAINKISTSSVSESSVSLMTANQKEAMIVKALTGSENSFSYHGL